MSISAATNYEFIVDNATLRLWCDNAPPDGFVSIDTEFERSRTYFAQLCLIQVAVADSVAIIDPLGDLDLQILFDFFAAHPGEKILHAARQDLEVLYFAGLTDLAPLIDSQLAAALLGYPEQIGYADLVSKVLNVNLDKSETRTDWRQRPLSEAQLHYAADDVRYLSAAWQILRKQLETAERLSWMAEDCAQLFDATVFDPPSTQAWQRVKGLHGLNRAAYSRAVALAEWREETARKQNLPRSWVVKDSELLEVAHLNPGDKRALARALGVDPKRIRRNGEEILQVLANAPQTTAVPEPMAALEPSERQRVKALASAIGSRAEQLQIAPSTLMTRREIEGVVRGGLAPRIEAGWRAEVLRDVLAPFLG